MLKQFVFIALIAIPGLAGAEELVPQDEPIRSARECPALFGDTESQKQNAENRESCLDAVQVCDYAINLLHHGDGPHRSRSDSRGWNWRTSTAPRGSMTEKKTARQLPTCA